MSVVQELVDAQSKIDMNVWAEMPQEKPFYGIFKSRTAAKATATNLFRVLAPFMKEHYPVFYEGLGLNDDRFFSNQLLLWNIHVWLLLRRLDYVPSKAAYVHYITKAYFTRFGDAHAGEDEEKVHPRIKRREKSNLPYLIYSFWLALDDAINQESDSMLVAALHRNDPVTDHFETVTVQQLENFVEYVRFQMAFLDGLDNERFLSAAWEWPAPSTMMHLPSSP
jgi:hypothetical protein